MAGDIYAQNRLFLGELVGVRIFVDLWIVCHEFDLLLQNIPEQTDLIGIFLLVDERDAVQQLFVDGDQPGTVDPEGIEHAGENHVFHQPLIQSHPAAAHDEIFKRGEFPVFVPLVHDGVDVGQADVAERDQPEADALPLAGKIGLAHVDIRRIDGHVAAL